MILYEYECAKCGKTFEAFSVYEQRQSHVCNICGTTAKRIFSSPRIFIERAGCVDGRSDEFWERAGRHQDIQLKKRESAEREKVHYGDKETMGKLENAHANYTRAGEFEKAEEVSRKVDES